MLFGICYLVTKWHTNKRLLIFGHRLTLTQLYALIGICSLPLFYIVGAGEYLFWVLGKIKKNYIHYYDLIFTQRY